MARLRNLAVLPAMALFLAWFLLLRPAFLGGPASYIWVTGSSMEPTLQSGDLAVVRRQGNYSPGDIVAFRVPKGQPGEGALVIHRVAGGTAEDGFIMQGDNKQNPDLWRPTQNDILGHMWLSVPGGGRFLAPLQSPVVLAGLAAAVVVFLVLIGEDKEKRQPQPSPAGRSRGRRLPPPGGLTLSLMLALIGTAAAFRSRH